MREISLVWILILCLSGFIEKLNIQNTHKISNVLDKISLSLYNCKKNLLSTISSYFLLK